MVMEILQVPVWDFSMGVEIPQLPEWDFPMPSMWGGDSPTANVGFLHAFYGRWGFSKCQWILQLSRWGISMGVGTLQMPMWDFSMGVEIPQLPWWDFPMPSMGGWGFSNQAAGDSPWMWRFPNCQNGISVSNSEG
ncbi:hypothetical protein BKA83DRAFT_4123623 [Pisolithus microcarpus]|nr:hypothetical protein BKA83DRAFT_4123623 [Pisolithus microcarpus]